VFERPLETTVLRPALLPVKTAQFTQFSHKVWCHAIKSLSLTESLTDSIRLCCKIACVFAYVRLGSWQSVYTQLWHRKTFCVNLVLKHCAANRKRWLSALPNIGPYIYIYIYIYIYTMLKFLVLQGAS
jgi:hypothetical protein